MIALNAKQNTPRYQQPLPSPVLGYSVPRIAVLTVSLRRGSARWSSLCRLAMNQEQSYTVKVSFDCPACRRRSVESTTLSPTARILMRGRAVEREKLACALCHAKLQPTTPIAVHILPSPSDPQRT